MTPRYSRYYTFIRPIAKNKYVKTYSSLVFSLIAIIIFSIFAIKPTISTILVLKKTIEEQQGVLDQLGRKAQNLSLGRDNLSKIDPQVKEKLNTLLPNQTDIPILTTSLNSLVQQNQASISSLQLQPTDLVGKSNKLTKDAPLKTIDFTLNVTGQYQNLLSLLNSLSSSKRLLSIDAVSINQTSSDNPLIMSINGQAYFLQD